MARPNDPNAIAGYVQGLREAKAAFQALPEIVREESLSAVEDTLSDIVAHAQANLAKSPSIDTRTLYNAIGFTLNRKSGKGRAGVQNVTTSITVAGQKRKVKVRGLIIAGRNGSALTSQGARKIIPRRYAHLVELGTRHSKAEPFMTPAAERAEKDFPARLKATGPAIERAMAAVGARTL